MQARKYFVENTYIGDEWVTVVEEGTKIQITPELVESVQPMFVTHHESRSIEAIEKSMFFFNKMTVFEKAIAEKNYKLFKCTMASGAVHYLNKNPFDKKYDNS